MLSEAQGFQLVLVCFQLAEFAQNLLKLSVGLQSFAPHVCSPTCEGIELPSSCLSLSATNPSTTSYVKIREREGRTRDTEIPITIVV